MSIRKKDMEQLLGRADLALTNAKEVKEINNYLKEYRYDEARLQEGRELYEKADKLYHQKQTKYGGWKHNIILVEQARKELNERYRVDLEVARVAFRKEKEVLSKLDGRGTRKVSLSGWMKQVNVFYSNALSDREIQERLADFGLGEEKLAAGKELVEKLEEAVSRKEAAKGEAQRATKERDRALLELRGWLADFRRIARLALREDPQLIEALGFVEPS